MIIGTFKVDQDLIPVTSYPVNRLRARRGNVEDHAQTRAKIIDVSWAIFCKGGLDALTMRAVAADVGMSVMGLYRYFSDKAELILALWIHVLQDAVAHVSAAMGPEATALGQLKASINAYLDFWENHPAEFRLIFTAEQTIGPKRQPKLIMTKAYQTAVNLSLPLMQRVADEIGGYREMAPLAKDLRMTMMTGYLYSRIINTRYPWANLDLLREHILNAILDAVIKCLLTPPVLITENNNFNSN